MCAAVADTRVLANYGIPGGCLLVSSLPGKSLRTLIEAWSLPCLCWFKSAMSWWPDKDTCCEIDTVYQVNVQQCSLYERWLIKILDCSLDSAWTRPIWTHYIRQIRWCNLFLWIYHVDEKMDPDHLASSETSWYAVGSTLFKRGFNILKGCYSMHRYC